MMRPLFGLPLALVLLLACQQRNSSVLDAPRESTEQTQPALLDSDHSRPGSQAIHTTGQIHLVVDRLKREVQFQSVPQRIVSLAPATTELIFAIGAGSQLVGVTKNCNYPVAAQSLTQVGGGTLQSLSREKIVSLQPDLVLCNWDNHQPMLETLDQFNIPALAIGPESFTELFAEATMLGKVTGHSREADELVRRMQQRLNALTTLVKSISPAERKSMFYEVWDDPLMTAGPSTFIGEVFQLAGLLNIFSDATTNYPKVSDELVVARDPEIIFAPSTHASEVSVEKLLQRQGWSDITAIRERQVYIINGDHISRCGPRLLDALDEVIRRAYPDCIPPSSVVEESSF